MTDPETRSDLDLDLVINGDGTAPSGPARLHWKAGRFVEITPLPPAGVPRTVGLSPLVDAHDHCLGLSPLAHHSLDQALESWIPTFHLRPAVEPGLTVLLALCRLARSGVGTVAHCPMLMRPDRLVEHLRGFAGALRRVGLRGTLIVPIRDHGLLAYGSDEVFLAAFPAGSPARSLAQDVLARRTPAAETLAALERLAPEVEGPDLTVQLGPVGPQWCTEATLELVVEHAERHDRRIHTHLLETRLQREWADARYPGGLLTRLDEIGLLSRRLTVAHGVWLRPDELELLAERGVTVATNASSNLRLRSGVAPLAALRDAGVAHCLGVDSLALDDDDDALRELRITALLEGVQPGTPRGMTALVGATTRAGARACGFPAPRLAPGGPADVLRLSGTLDDVLLPGAGLAEISLARARAEHVETLVVAGRRVVTGGRVTGLDEAALAGEVRDRAAALARRTDPTLVEAVEHMRSRLAAWHAAGGHRVPPHTRTGGGQGGVG